MANLKNLVLFSLFVCTSCSLWGQRDSSFLQNQILQEKDKGWWTFNLEGGLSFLQSDLKARIGKGYGFGIGVEKNLSYSSRQLLIPHLRWRLHYSSNKGLGTEAFSGLENNTALNGSRREVEPLDYNSNPGFIFPNYKNMVIETGLELPVYFNPARLNNWHIGAFAGIGIGWYHVDTDQRNGLGEMYDYGNAPFNEISDLSESDAISLLEREWDEDYETAADGFDDKQFLSNLMPTLGLELGYVTNQVTLGVNYRMTLSGDDLLDGVRWNDNNTKSSDNDIIHSPGIFLKWDIQSRSTQKSVLSPEIELKTPIDNNVVTQNPLAIIRTKVRYIKSVKDINVTHNGMDYDVFQYYNKELATNVPLIEGENKIIITASNQSGTDQVIYNYTYTPGSNSDYRGSKPIIKFVNPEVDNQNVLGLDLDLKLEPIGVSSERDIRIFVNEQEQLNFIYRRQDPFLNLPIKLLQGKNTIRVVAINKNGISQESRTVFTDNSGALASFNLIHPDGELLTTNTSSTPVEILINGLVEKKDLAFFVNDQKYPFEYDEETQRIKSEVFLMDGTNIIELILKNKTSNIRQKIKVIRSGTRKRTNEEPTLDLNKRSDQFEVSEFIPIVWDPSSTQCSYNLELIYPTSLNGDEIEIFLNNDQLENFVIFEEEKILRKALNLNEGRNYLKIRDKSQRISVYDKILSCEADQITTISSTETPTDHLDRNDDRNTTSPVIKETIEQPVQPELNEEETTSKLEEVLNTSSTEVPSIQVLSPIDTRTDLSTPLIKYEAMVSNVRSREDITIYFNDNIIEDYDFDPSTGKITFNQNATQEKNSISLIVFNAKGVADDVRFFSYVQLDPPEIFINSPRNQARFETNKVELSGQILRVKDSGIIIKNNGKIVPDWTREGQSFSGNLNLNEGVNKIEINARNTTASKTKTIYVYYDPVLSPVIQFINPEKSSSDVIHSSLPIVARIGSVKSKDRITFSVNGISRTDFTFENGSLNTLVTLREGVNKIQITASNKIGQDQKEISVNYRIPRPPQITFVRPSRDKALVKETPYKMEARIRHISESDRLKLKLNGQEVEIPSVSEDGMLRCKLDLILGINEIVLEAENQDGGDARSINVNYQTPKPPIINILSPKENTVVEKSSLEFQANILRVNSADNIELKNNGVTQRFKFSESALSALLSLQEGTNRISISAANGDGRESKDLLIDYKKPIPSPIIDWYAPRESGTEVNTKLYKLSLKVDHVKSKSGINLLLNGQKVDFSFDAALKSLRSELMLLEGINEISVEASNESGSARAKSTINYKKPEDQSSKLPQIRIISVGDVERSAFDENQGQVAIVAEVNNIDNSNQILLLVNNEAITNFAFQENTGRLIATLLLKRGINKIILKATNSYGNSSDTKTINF